MKTKNVLLSGLLLLLIICMTSWTFSQQGRGRGRIYGTVKDTARNPLKDVKIIAEHIEYGTKFESKSNKKGSWAVAGLGTGYFRISAELEGYGTVFHEMKISQFSKKNPPVDLTLQNVSVQDFGVSPIRKEEAIALFEEGNKLFEAKEYSKAVLKFEEFLEKNPEIYQININIGNCYKEIGEYEKAITAYNTMLDKIKEGKTELAGDEGASRALSGIGETYIEQGELEKAAGYLQRAINIFPDDETLAFNIGEIFFKQGEAAKGIEYFILATEIKSDWAPPYRQMGYAYLNQADYKMAIENFKKFIELAPDDPLTPTINNLIPKLEEMIK